MSRVIRSLESIEWWWARVSRLLIEARRAPCAARILPWILVRVNRHTSKYSCTVCTPSQAFVHTAFAGRRQAEAGPSPVSWAFWLTHRDHDGLHPLR